MSAVKKEPTDNSNDSPILIQEKTSPQILPSTSKAKEPAQVISKSSQNDQTIFLNEESSDEDIDIILCNFGEAYEKQVGVKSTKISPTSPLVININENKKIEVKNNFNLTPKTSNTKQAKKINNLIFDQLIGSPLSSSSSEEDEPSKKPEQTGYSINRLSTKTPLKPPQMGLSAAKVHSEIALNENLNQNPLKRNIMIDSSFEQPNQLNNKKPKISPLQSKPVTKSPETEIIENNQTMEVDEYNEEYEGLNKIDAQKKELLKKLKPKPNLIVPKKSTSSGITNKKTVDLLLNNKFKKNSQIREAPCNSIGLTQCINLAKQENIARFKNILANQQKQEEKQIAQEISTPSVSTNQILTNNQTSNPKINLSKPTRLVEKAKEIRETNSNQKENECKQPKKHSDSSSKSSTTTSLNQNDVVGRLINEMNNQNGVNNLNENKNKESSAQYIFENFLFRLLKCPYNWLEEQGW